MNMICNKLIIITNLCDDPIHAERADAGFPRMRFIFSWAETRRRHAYIFVRLQNGNALKQPPDCEMNTMTKNISLTLFSLLWLSIQAAEGQVSPAPNSWGLGTPMPTTREGAFTGVIGSNIYVIGGQASGASLAVNEIYDITTNSWSSGA